ncbi:16099_t:CDS:1 [Cetraspora pellucida]|uniref:16099_t:CDS:1 n=1 Tax=Cetraspora pellucida TaxID=1433469 RepID=A0A9N9J526_9GLOM|nr:16099_t:CDS:1 [Cetraspora pellucida]
MPCPGKTFTSSITWYSPKFINPEELSFCEECYNQFIRNTPLNMYMRNDGTFIGVCDFSVKIQEQWLTAVSGNDINIFRKYVEPKVVHVRTIRSEYANLQSHHSLETQRKGVLVYSQLKNRGQGAALELIDNRSQRYFFNNRTYSNSGAAHAAQLQIQVDECSRKINNHLVDMGRLENKRANYWHA